MIVRLATRQLAPGGHGIGICVDDHMSPRARAPRHIYQRRQHPALLEASVPPEHMPLTSDHMPLTSANPRKNISRLKATDHMPLTSARSHAVNFRPHAVNFRQSPE